MSKFLNNVYRINYQVTNHDNEIFKLDKEVKYYKKFVKNSLKNIKKISGCYSDISVSQQRTMGYARYFLDPKTSHLNKIYKNAQNVETFQQHSGKLLEFFLGNLSVDFFFC